MNPELVQVLCWVMFGVFGVLCLHISSKYKTVAPFALWVGIGIMMAVAGCMVLHKEDAMRKMSWEERMQELEECYRQEGDTCLATARRTAERWGGDVILIGGSLHTVDGAWAWLVPSKDTRGHAFVLYKEHEDYWEIKDSNHGRLNMYKSELDKVVWALEEGE